MRRKKWDTKCQYQEIGSWDPFDLFMGSFAGYFMTFCASPVAPKPRGFQAVCHSIVYPRPLRRLTTKILTQGIPFMTRTASSLSYFE